MSDQSLQVETHLRIAKLPSEVYEAIVNPDKMSCYFISWGSDRLDLGTPVTWRWDDYGVQLTVAPRKVDPDRTVSFDWSASGSDARVEFSIEPDGEDATVVRVTETGWPLDATGVSRCLQQMQGWTHMLCCLKAWMEYGINLRRGGVVK